MDKVFKFKNRLDLKTYLSSISKDDGLIYLNDWLIERTIEKELTYAPSEFEIRSLILPSIKFINQYYGQGSYEKLCSQTGLKLKHNYNLLPDFSFSPIEVFCDTREQHPYCNLEYPINIIKLDFADYCPNPNPENLYFERKEISDWAGVMSKGYERFIRELQRAKDNKAYIIILIEAKYSDLLSINYLPQTRWIKATSTFLFKRARDLYQKFDNFQMVAGGTRKECIDLFNKLIKIKNIQNFDIQYLIDTNNI